jgi:hypothetical protein
MPWYKDISDAWPLVKNGYIDVPMTPGMGVKVHEEAIRPLCRQGEFFTDPTTQWDSQRGWDRIWSLWGLAPASAHLATRALLREKIVGQA